VQIRAEVVPGVCCSARGMPEARGHTRRRVGRGTRTGAEDLTEGAFGWENPGALAYCVCRGALQVRNNSNRIAVPSG
jgi:hypothetical protein